MKQLKLPAAYSKLQKMFQEGLQIEDIADFGAKADIWRSPAAV